MSRVGKIPVPIPGGVTVKINGLDVSVTGPKGTSSWTFPDGVEIAQDDEGKHVVVKRLNDEKQSRANHGLTRALIANMITGVTTGFEKRLQIFGTGYNCKLQNGVLHLNVGFMGRRRGIGSQFELKVPSDLEVVVEKEAARGDNDPAQLVIRGVSKQSVGQFAAEVRSLRKSEPYKGKGIRYDDEQIVRKQGKALAGGG